MMSRFRTATEQKRDAGGFEKGFVDVLIGTHRVLSKDVVFKNLGLLIIDENSVLVLPIKKNQTAQGKCGRSDTDGHADPKDAPYESDRDT